MGRNAFCLFLLSLLLLAGIQAEGQDAPSGTTPAEKELRARLTAEDLTLRERGNTLLRLGHAARAARRMEDARRWYQQVVDLANAPFGFSSHARLCIAQTHIDEKQWAKARAVLMGLHKDKNAPFPHRNEALERAEEVARLEKGLPAFDPQASRTSPPLRPEPGRVLHVSPEGKAGNSGTREAPLPNLEAARDAIRSLKAGSGLPKGGILVLVHPGTYPATETLEFSEQDGGTAEAPIVYKAKDPGTAVVSGGKAVSGFKPVVDEAILARLPEEARGKVQSIDLKALGITEYGEMQPHGTTIGDHPLFELFVGGKAMRLARWPNEGYIRNGQVYTPKGKEAPQITAFDCSEKRLARWGLAKDPWIFGFPRFLWSDASMPVASIDAETGRVTLGVRYFAYGGDMKADMPLYFYNLLEEIDQPGEYYLDREMGVLYFLPPADSSLAEVSLLAEPFITMDKVAHVAFEGLTFELGQTHAVQIAGGADCLMAGCAFRKLGGNAIMLEGGKRHGVVSCDMEVLGMGGVRINAGDRATLTRADHYVENCHIFDFSRVNRTYTPAVHVDGVGMRIAHNEFHHSPCHAIRLNGNEHRVELNEVYDVNLESDDQGGLDMWFDPTHRGNTIRYNYWHDIGRPDSPCGAAGVRLDDAISETVVYGNVFRRCSKGHFGGVQIHGGKENFVENNIFIDCASAISFSHWGADRWARFMKDPRVVTALTETVDIQKTPYSTRYPALAHLAENPDINRVWRNIVYHCGEFMARDNGKQEVMDNLITHEDPGFVNASKENFALRPDAPALQALGFHPIPFGAIGLYDDDYRKN